MKTLLILVAFVSTCCFAESGHDVLLDEVLAVTEKVLDFFAQDYSAINVDGLFGLRLGQGQLLAAIKECQSHDCNPALLETLQNLEHRLDEACEAALPYVKEVDPAYFDRFEATINKPYELEYTSTLFTGLPDGKGSNGRYNEEKGDQCYGRVMGTFVENERTLPKCNITDTCLSYMTKPGTTDYFVTHQLLYFIMTEHVGCKGAMESYSNGQKVADIQKGLCNTIYLESRLLENGGQVRAHRKDLFLEQTLLCGVLGFEDFMRPDWIRMVLTWPDMRLGCFRSQLYKLMRQMENEKQALNAQTGTGNRRRAPLGDAMYANMELERGSTMRKLLREKQMKDGCLSHTSGLGFGVLATYLRFLVRYTTMV